jgi:hypothetical protein
MVQNHKALASLAFAAGSKIRPKYFSGHIYLIRVVYEISRNLVYITLHPISETRSSTEHPNKVQLAVFGGSAHSCHIRVFLGACVHEQSRNVQVAVFVGPM